MSLSTDTRTKVVLLGAGGHARVCFDILKQDEAVELLGVFSPDLTDGEIWLEDYRCQGDDSNAEELLRSQAGIVCVNGLGFLPKSSARKRLAKRFESYRFLTLQHYSAVISSSVKADAGVQFMARSCVQYGTKIAQHSIVNTGAQIDHDCRIGAFCHLAPGSIICGDVIIEDEVFIGAGAIVTQGVTVGKGAVIGAGVTVKHNVSPNQWIK